MICVIEKYLKPYVEPAQNADCGTTAKNNGKKKSVVSEQRFTELYITRSGHLSKPPDRLKYNKF